MKQNTTESFRVESEILNCIKLITKKTGQTTKGYISVVLKKQIEKDLKKHYKITEIEC
jgi:predicted DNA-binding protein